MADVHYTTRTIVENMAWWVMHIMHDAFDMDTAISQDKSKATCMDILLNAYGR